MSDTPLITEKANYNARAGETIAGNLARGGDGKFTSGGNATASAQRTKPPQNYGGKRAAANAKLQQRLAARRAAAAKKSKPKGGKGKVAAKPKSNAVAARRAEVEKRRQVRAAEAAKRKADRDAAKLQRDVARKVDATARTAKRDQAKADRVAELAKRKAEIERRKAERAKSGGGGKGKATPKAAPDKSAELAANRTKVQAATLDSGAFSALQGMRDGATPAAGAALDTLVKSGLVERDVKGGYRISEAGRAYTNAAERGDIGRAKDAMSRAADRAARLEELARRRGRSSDQPVRGALQPRTKERSPDRTTSAGHTGVMIYLPLSDDVKAQIAALDGVTQPAEELHITLAYLGDSTEAPLSTSKARVLELIGEWSGGQWDELTGSINGYGRFMTVEDGDTNAVYLSPDLPDLPAFRASLVDWLSTTGIEYAQGHGYTPHVTVAYVPVAEPTPALKPDDIMLSINTVSVAWGDEHYDFPLGDAATKEHATSVAVFKQANGVYRWLGVSSTAYQDRDKQFVSLKALQADCERADRDRQYGPLRFWHMPGVDIGTTDYNAVIGRSLVESGEISDPRIGHALATSKEHWQMSLGFLHSRDQPQGDTYTQIRRFERSILPASAASNPFTSLLVYKGNTMSTPIAEKEAKLKELINDPDILSRLLAQVDRTEKAADAAGVRYKEGAAEDGESASAETKAAGDDGGDMSMAEDDAAAEDAPGSILEDADLDAIADRVVAKLGPMLEALGAAATTKATVAMPSNLDVILNGFAQVAEQTKEAADQATSTAKAASAKADEAAANVAEIAKLKERLAELEGDQPRGTAGGYRASQTAETVATKAHTVPAEDEMIKAANWLVG